MSALETPLTQALGIEIPMICGAMYPCSNPELVAAASQAGGIGIVQPISLVYVHGHEFRAGLQHIKQLTDKPFGMNVIVEKAAKAYEKRMREWVDVALEEGVKFLITALGDPKWVVDLAHQRGVVVFHDVVNRRHAEKALARGVDGLICVNSRAGGHAGDKTPEALYEELADLGVPLVCAGGIGAPADFAKALDLGYAGVQMGTRFIATKECKVHADYQRAIIDAKAEDIVLTDRISGVPVAVIKTPYIEKVGTKAGFLGRILLRGRRTKHMMRAIYMLKSLWSLKNASLKGTSYRDYFQAGKSVDGIDSVETVAEVYARFKAAVVPASEPA